MKKMIVISLFLIPLFLNSTVIPGGDVSGNWDINGNPYYIDGEITIQSGEELVIDAGVDVIFNDHYKFIIYGRLEAIGTANDSISFKPLDEQIGWHGLRFIDGNLSGLSDNVIDFCRFENGLAIGQNDDTCGGAIFCSNSGNLTISNSYFFQNDAQWDGGGIYLEDNSDVNIDNCIFKLNQCGFYGASIITYGSETVVENCVFESNDSEIFGAGFSSWDGSNSELYNCTFIANYAGACTGIYTVSSSLILANVKFRDNETEFGSGAAVGITSSSVEVSNMTAADNSSPLSGGAFWLNGGTLNVYNSILWNNLPEDIFVLSGTSTVANSCVSDGTTGTNVISDDPQFIDYAGYDYHLTETSPCIDTGDETLVSFTLPEFDLDGNERIVDGDENGTATIDMGCYEYFIPLPTTGFIAGVVTDLDGNTLENAEISAGAYNTLTNNMGEYEMEVEAGDYTVTCSLDGYEDPEAEIITVIAGETTVVDFILEPEVGADGILPNHLISLNNYPNPFNPVTTISFDLNEYQTGTVEIDIFNMKGQKIRTFQIDPSITQSVTWNGKDMNGKSLSSGVYLYKLSIDDKEIAAKKCLMMK